MHTPILGQEPVQSKVECRLEVIRVHQFLFDQGVFQIAEVGRRIGSVDREVAHVGQIGPRQSHGRPSALVDIVSQSQLVDPHNGRLRHHVVAVGQVLFARIAHTYHNHLHLAQVRTPKHSVTAAVDYLAVKLCRRISFVASPHMPVSPGFYLSEQLQVDVHIVVRRPYVVWRIHRCAPGGESQGQLVFVIVRSVVAPQSDKKCQVSIPQYFVAVLLLRVDKHLHMPVEA